MRRLQFAVAILAAAMSASPASAQLGGLMKKAKSAVEKKADNAIGKTDLMPVNAFGAPLTEQTLDAVIRGLAASQAKIDEAKLAQAEADKYNKLMSQAAAGHDKEREDYRETSNKIENCQSTFIEARRDSLAKAFQAKMLADPAARAEATQAATNLGAEYTKLLQAGDTVGAQKLMAQRAMKLMGDPKLDTAAAIKKCGVAPAKPAWLGDEEKYRAQWEAANNKSRKIEEEARTAGLSASGMSKENYGLARERIINWLQEKNGGKAVQLFTDEERRAMEARNADIQKYSRQLRG
jgi:hypothetical protein